MRPFSKQEIQAEPAFLFLAVSGHVVVVVLALVLVLIPVSYTHLTLPTILRV